MYSITCKDAGSVSNTGSGHILVPFPRKIQRANIFYALIFAFSASVCGEKFFTYVKETENVGTR